MEDTPDIIHILLVVPTFLGLNDPGCWRRDGMTTELSPFLFETKGNEGGSVFSSPHHRQLHCLSRSNWKKFIEDVRAPRKLRLVFYNFFFYLMSTLLLNRNKHIWKDFLFVSHTFKSPSTILLLPLRYRFSGVKQTFWALQNFWPIIVCQLSYFSEQKNKVWPLLFDMGCVN